MKKTKILRKTQGPARDPKNFVTFVTFCLISSSSRRLSILSPRREPASPIRDITKSDGRAMVAYPTSCLEIYKEAECNEGFCEVAARISEDSGRNGRSVGCFLQETFLARTEELFQYTDQYASCNYGERRKSFVTRKQ